MYKKKYDTTSFSFPPTNTGIVKLDSAINVGTRTLPFICTKFPMTLITISINIDIVII